MSLLDELTKEERALVDMVLGDFYRHATDRGIPINVLIPVGERGENSVTHALAGWIIASRIEPDAK